MSLKREDYLQADVDYYSSKIAECDHRIAQTIKTKAKWQMYLREKNRQLARLTR